MMVIIGALQALATFAAVLVALFQDRIRELLLHAKLDLDIVAGISIPVNFTGANRIVQVAAHHYRLQLRARGGSAATRAEIFVTKIWENGQTAGWWSPRTCNGLTEIGLILRFYLEAHSDFVIF